jgi:hypothetical protein
MRSAKLTRQAGPSCRSSRTFNLYLPSDRRCTETWLKSAPRDSGCDAGAFWELPLFTVRVSVVEGLRLPEIATVVSVQVGAALPILISGPQPPKVHRKLLTTLLVRNIIHTCGSNDSLKRLPRERQRCLKRHLQLGDFLPTPTWNRLSTGEPR